MNATNIAGKQESRAARVPSRGETLGRKRPIGLDELISASRRRAFELGNEEENKKKKIRKKRKKERS